MRRSITLNLMQGHGTPCPYNRYNEFNKFFICGRVIEGLYMNFEPLIKILEAEVDIYKNFKEIEENKTGIITAGDIEKLDGILNTEEMLRMKLQNIEKKRIEAMRTLGLGDKTLSEVIKIAQGKDKEKLSAILEDINLYIDALKQINDRNTKLVSARLDVISSVAKIFKEKPANTNIGNKKTSEKIYGKNAKVLDQPDEFGSSVISKKI